jgi:MoaA/NifB/PqqE/SkfB family radical SAM enzyme
VTETLLHVTTHVRVPARLDDPGIDAPDPSIASLVAVASNDPVVLVGGEPTLRADLPELLAALPSPILCTDALALTNASTMRALRDAGMRKLRVSLHAARPAAHDWLVGQAGAAKRAMRALVVAAELGIETEIEATITRPTAPHLAELVTLAAGVRARAVHLVRLTHRGLAGREAIMLVPRLALLEDPLAEAGAVAIRERIALHVHDFPRCVAPRSIRVSPPDGRRHAFVDAPEWALVSRAYEVAFGERCGACPGLPACAGPPADYVARFGAVEIVSERPRVERARDESAATNTVAPRAGRTPATRLREVRAVVRRGGVEGDPLIDRAGAPPDVLRVALTTEPTRVLRARLIRAAQEGARVLRIVGAFDHPSAAALLRECAHLRGVAVEIAGDLRPLFALADAQLFELEGIERARIALGDPSEIDAANAFLDRALRMAKIRGTRFVVVRSTDDVERWREAFDRLDDDAFVRVARDESAITTLTPSLPPSRYRDAIERALARAAAPSFVDAIVENALRDDEPA